MFKEGNQIVVKATGEEGFIYDTTALDDGRILVAITDATTMTVRFMHESNLELKKCFYSKDGVCDYRSGYGLYACTKCKEKREEFNKYD